MYKIDVGHIFYTKELTSGDFYYWFGRSVSSNIINNLYKSKNVILKITFENSSIVPIQVEFTKQHLFSGVEKHVYVCFHHFNQNHTTDNEVISKVEMLTNNNNEKIIYQKVEDNE